MSSPTSKAEPSSTSMESINQALASTSLESQTTSLNEFTIFPTLPVELQLKIWEAADVPYKTPQVHHITTHVCSTAQRARVPPLPNGIWDAPADYQDLPIGFKNLRDPNHYFREGRPTIHISPLAIHPLLYACQNSRKTMLGHNLLFAFGTYVNMDHDSIFLDIGPSESTIQSVISYLPTDFPGLAIRDSLIDITERMEPSAIWDGLGKLTIVHSHWINPRKNAVDNPALIEFERFWGDKVPPGDPDRCDPVIKRHVVSVPRYLVEGLEGVGHEDIDYYWVKEPWFDDDNDEDDAGKEGVGSSQEFGAESSGIDKESGVEEPDTANSGAGQFTESERKYLSKQQSQRQCLNYFLNTGEKI